MLILTFDRGTPLNVRLGSVPDEFEAEFSISSDGMVVKVGTNEPSQHAGTFKANYTARYLTFFDAQAGKNYELSFRISKADATLISTNPVLTISVFPGYSL